VLLDPVEEEGPFEVTATSRDCSIALGDVLFGDVWVCSGQSNMAHRLENVSPFLLSLAYMLCTLCPRLTILNLTLMT
jgi:hypothetical protein